MDERYSYNEQQVKKKLNIKDDSESETVTLIYHYLFNLLCFQYKIISVEYFMEECTEWELNDIVNNIPYVDRNLWESSRLLAYVVAQVNSRKKLELPDICKFKWEEKTQDESDIEITDAEIARLNKLAKQWED